MRLRTRQDVRGVEACDILHRARDPGIGVPPGPIRGERKLPAAGHQPEPIQESIRRGPDELGFLRRASNEFAGGGAQMRALVDDRAGQGSQ